jgi:hypothetical protein
MFSVGFLADDVDEAAFVDVIIAQGAVILPKSYSAWPIPAIPAPLPRPADLESYSYVIWYPEVFSEREMNLEENRRLLPHEKLYCANQWPVLDFLRSHEISHSVYWGNLGFSASVTSFRIYTNEMRTRVTDLSATELADFTARLKRLEKLYRRLCSWMRRRWVALGRARYCGPSAHRWLPEFKSLLNPDA